MTSENNIASLLSVLKVKAKQIILIKNKKAIHDSVISLRCKNTKQWQKCIFNATTFVT